MNNPKKIHILSEFKADLQRTSSLIIETDEETEDNMIWIANAIMNNQQVHIHHSQIKYPRNHKQQNENQHMQNSTSANTITSVSTA